MGLVESARKQLIFFEESGMWGFFISGRSHLTLFSYAEKAGLGHCGWLSASCLQMSAGDPGARGGHWHVQLSARLTTQRCH